MSRDVKLHLKSEAQCLLRPDEYGPERQGHCCLRRACEELAKELQKARNLEILQKLRPSLELISEAFLEDLRSTLSA